MNYTEWAVVFGIIAGIVMQVAWLFLRQRALIFELNSKIANLYLEFEQERLKNLFNPQLNALNTLLDCGGPDAAGGVHKRIAEIREVTHAVAPRAHELDAVLLSWLSANEQFLCNLRDIMRPPGVDKRWDEVRELFHREN